MKSIKLVLKACQKVTLNTQLMQMSRSNFMHLMRWTAALFVVMSHLRSIVFVDFNKVEHMNLFLEMFYFITSLGHEAVIVFFVLSGFLISRSIIRQIQNDVFSFSQYTIKRVSRLYSVLPVALILTGIFDILGSNINLELYNNALHIPALNFSIVEHLTIYHFLYSLFMLQNIVLPPLGSNGPLWSLNCEFWYYFLFPALCIPAYAYYKKSSVQYKSIYLVLGLCIIVLLPALMLKYFTLWLTGLVPIFWSSESKIVKYATSLLFFLILLSKSVHLLPVSEFQSDLTLSVLFTLCLSTFSDKKINEKSIAINELLASFSYTTYLVHLPFILLLSSVAHKLTGWGLKMQPSAISFAYFGLTVILVYSFSYSVAYFTELKTEKFAQYLTEKTRFGSKIQPEKN